MKCPSCGFPDSQVVDSRPIEDGSSIRRRRECKSCGKRFTTFEVIDHIQVLVLKKDGTKELFDRSKLLSGLMKACQKRPVNAEQIATEIETELQNSLRPEVTTTEIGELAMRKLKSADPVAYVLFASVYREFKDVETFMEELRGLQTASAQEDQV